MQEDIVYSIVSLLPFRNRQYAYSTLDRAMEELEIYLIKNNLELNEVKQDRIKIAILLNFIDDLFVNSYYSYIGALSLLKKQKVDVIRFGRNSYSKDDSLYQEWNKLVDAFKRLKNDLSRFHIPTGKSIRELVEEVMRDNPE